MAHSHYVMDLYYPDGGDPDRFRREVLRIEADNDEAAIEEGRRADQWRKTSYYRIRSITNSARSGDKLIFSSGPL
jgi:hypothetical protein